MGKIDIDGLYRAASIFKYTATPKGGKSSDPCTKKELNTAVDSMYNAMIILIGELKNLD